MPENLSQFLQRFMRPKTDKPKKSKLDLALAMFKKRKG